MSVFNTESKKKEKAMLEECIGIDIRVGGFPGYREYIMSNDL